MHPREGHNIPVQIHAALFGDLFFRMLAGPHDGAQQPSAMVMPKSMLHHVSPLGVLSGTRPYTRLALGPPPLGLPQVLVLALATSTSTSISTSTRARTGTSPKPVRVLVIIATRNTRPACRIQTGCVPHALDVRCYNALVPLLVPSQRRALWQDGTPLR